MTDREIADVLAEMRGAFDGNDVPRKNRALRWGWDALSAAQKRADDGAAVLRDHHQWHLDAGTIGLPDGEGGWVEIDDAAEYSDSLLYERTRKALHGLPPDDAGPMPRGGISVWWWAQGILERRKRRAAERQLSEMRADRIRVVEGFEFRLRDLRDENERKTALLEGVREYLGGGPALENMPGAARAVRDLLEVAESERDALALQVAGFREALGQIARMTKDGEEVEGSEYEMAIDDAFETAAGCIDIARQALASSTPSDHSGDADEMVPPLAYVEAERRAEGLRAELERSRQNAANWAVEKGEETMRAEVAEARVKELEGEVSCHQSEMDGWESDLASVKANLEAAEAERDRLLAEVAAKGTLDGLDFDGVVALQQENGALRDALAGLLDSVRAHNEANGRTMVDPHAEAEAEKALSASPAPSAAAVVRIDDLEAALNERDMFINPEALERAADEIDCCPGCDHVWREWDTNASGCRRSEEGEYCPNDVAETLRAVAKVASHKVAAPDTAPTSALPAGRE